MSRRPPLRWPDKKPLRIPIPPCRDPFVNTNLLRLTPNAEGRDRFWISSFNGAFGCLGVCVDEWGEHRIYRTNDFRHAGFYSAVQTSDNTLWLCGDLSRVVRLDLDTGVFETFPTGAPSALVFAGMIYDPKTAKLFFIAHPASGVTGVSFDTHTGKTVKVHAVKTSEHYMRSHFAHGDGTWSAVLHTPGLSFVRWDPATETIKPRSILAAPDENTNISLTYRMIADDDGRQYLPGRGWYNPRSGRIGRGPHPEDDGITWFARNETAAFGTPPGESEVHRWDLQTGRVRKLFSAAKIGFLGSSLSRSGKVLCVSRTGTFTRHDAMTGELELSRRLDTNAVQNLDCVIRIDRDRLLGTPFITQRFWEANIRTGKGMDCGPAAPGGGEILRVWNVGGKIYMAAYAGGQLTEYDPALPANFPENPRVVAAPPTGMRPFAAADDGVRIFYACNHPYGQLGSIMTRYHTRTGAALYRDNPIPDQQIVSLFHEKASNSLLCGSSYMADGGSITPATDRTVLARLPTGQTRCGRSRGR
ncbi:MAG: NHL repeat-containing protein [Planctomycetota bacterium]|jgi:hypothetical protein